MKTLFSKVLIQFTALTLVVWSTGAPMHINSVSAEEIGPELTTVQDKYTVCHATGSASNPWERINIAESAIGAHLNHGADYIVLDNDNTAECPDVAPDPYPTPVVDANFHSGNTSVLITWDEITDGRLDGYKVVMSESNPNPAYPGDGYIQWETDSTVTSFDYPYQYVCDQNYYFSVTALYDGHDDPGETVPGNAVTLNYACGGGGFVCPDADYAFDVDLYVMGENCVTGGPSYQIVDSEDISLTEAGNYTVMAEVHRSPLDSAPYGQDNEEFTLRVNAGSDGPVVLDQPPGVQAQMQDAGDFDFTSGTNTVYMDTAHYCPTSDTMVRNSVEVKQLCLYKNDEPEEETATVIAHKIVCEDEADLPNWSGGTAITATTAQDFVDSHPNCSFASDWKFEWGTNNSLLSLDGDYIGEHNVAGWYDFDTLTDVNGKAEVELNIDDLETKTWFREVLKDGYIPYSFPPGSAPGSDESAEFWCHSDILNYDNAEWINNIAADNTYYCIAFNVETPPEYSPYCGDGIVNQEWEECEIPILSSVAKDFVGCSEQCQYVTPECSDLTLAKVNVDLAWNEPGGNGDMSSDLFLGSDSYRIPSGVWVALYWNGNYYLDNDLSAYEDVPGFAVQRLEDSLRVVMHGTATAADKEHVDGNIEFYNATVTGQSSDNSNDYPNNNRLEKGFDGYYNPNAYQAGDDEVWVADGKSYYWLTTTTADDGYYTDWAIIEDCEDDTSICGVKFEDKNKDTRQGEGELNLSGWTINLFEKTSCDEGDEWADSVVAYNPGPNVPTERSNPNQALGVAEDDDTINFVSLGIGGELILEFDNLIENGAGDDVQVFETSFGDPDCNAYPEYVHVYASQDGTNWTSLGSACQAYDPSFDLGSLPWAKYVKLVDETSNTPDGFDLDGVKALNCLNTSQEPLESEVTTENGYCFEDLEAGHYMVCEEMQEGWSNSTPLCQQVMLEEDEEITVDFGNYFNVIEPNDPAPWCSALLGALKAYYDPSSSAYGIYNEVIDLHKDGVIDLSDVATVSQVYYEADDEACYYKFEKPETPEQEFYFACEDPNVGWCTGLVQGVTDFYGQAYVNDDFHPRYDLNDDGVVNLTDLAMVGQLLGDNDQVACYTYYVPPFLMCPIEKPYCGDGIVTPDIGETCDGDEPQSCTTDDGYTGMQSCNMPQTETKLQSVEQLYCVWNECVTDEYCGDGVVNGAEECDGTEGCSELCTEIDEPFCGNGIVEEGETCDDGPNGSDTCTAQCSVINNGCVTNCGGGSTVHLPGIYDVEGQALCTGGTTITWKTTLNSVTWLIYGTDENNLDQEYKSDTEGKDHSFTLEDLEEGESYYYIVKAENKDGQTRSGNYELAAAADCGPQEVLGEKIEEEICQFMRPSGSTGPDADIVGVFTFPDGALIRGCDPEMKVYEIRDQKKFHIPSVEYLMQNYFYTRIYNVLQSVVDSYPDWTPQGVAGVKEYADGSLLRGSDHKVYVIKNGKKQHIPNLEELRKYAGQQIFDVSDDILAQY